MNNVNIRPDGSRRCFMKEYNLDNDGKEDGCIDRICKAWGVVDRFDIDNHNEGKPRPCGHDFSRHFLLKFDDGLWRFCSFGGISGEPMASCTNKDTVVGETGKIAWLNGQILGLHAEIASEERNMHRLKKHLAKFEAELATERSQLPNERRNEKKEGPRTGPRKHEN